ncbi:MAG TPA: hypothetical protein VKE26_18435, partial [Xanthobacteraceae bacterium]|nr:hypothetical protein [Xanthobacteraceae bacterium]
MDPMRCTCPRCLSGRAGEFEFEYESFEGEEISEQEELELAMELLSVQNEYEMEQFLGKLVSGIGRGIAPSRIRSGRRGAPWRAPALPARRFPRL